MAKIIRLTGNNSIYTGTENDEITTGMGDDTINSGGDDIINAGGGTNRIDVGVGNDRVTASGNNNITGGYGDKTITLEGLGTNNITLGSGLRHTIDAGAGNETVVSQAKLGTYNLGDGNNKITLAQDAGATITVGTGNNVFDFRGASATPGKLHCNKDIIQTGNGNATIYGSQNLEQASEMYTMSRTGNITADLGTGINKAIYHTGQLAGNVDVIVGNADSNSMHLSHGNNQITSNFRDKTNISVGNGNNTITAHHTATSVRLPLPDGNFSMVVMGYGNNTLKITGVKQAVMIYGGGGTNNITVSADVFRGEILLDGLGGLGNDTISLAGGTYNRVDTGLGADALTLGSGVYEQINTGEGADRLILNGGTAVSIDTGAGNDQLTLTSNTRGGQFKTGEGHDIVTSNLLSGVYELGNGDDQFKTSAKGAGTWVDAGQGHNTIDFRLATNTGVDARIFDMGAMAGDGNNKLYASNHTGAWTNFIVGKGDNYVHLGSGQGTTVLLGGSGKNVIEGSSANMGISGFEAHGSNRVTHTGMVSDVLLGNGNNTITLGYTGTTAPSTSLFHRVTVGSGNNIIKVSGNGMADIDVNVAGGKNTITTANGDDSITLRENISADTLPTVSYNLGFNTLNSGAGNDLLDIIGNLSGNYNLGGGADTADIQLTHALSSASKCLGGTGSDVLNLSLAYNSSVAQDCAALMQRIAAHNYTDFTLSSLNLTIGQFETVNIVYFV